LRRTFPKGSRIQWGIGTLLLKGRDLAGHPFLVETFRVIPAIDIQHEGGIERGCSEIPIMSFPCAKQQRKIGIIDHKIMVQAPSYHYFGIRHIGEKFEPVSIHLEEGLLSEGIFAWKTVRVKDVFPSRQSSLPFHVQIPDFVANSM